ncbi:Hint domain-containing protein, partial [Microbispora triticiradicis]|uniref:Hint domain-containing protein n=1 Tax=Microbispora triticiradicis TaxID=2200763 RepID=UPI001FCCC963
SSGGKKSSGDGRVVVDIDTGGGGSNTSTGDSSGPDCRSIRNCGGDDIEDPADGVDDMVDDIIDDAAPDLPQNSPGMGGGSCMPNSFVAGTKVLIADGSHKPIEDIEVGDHVLAADPVSGTTEAKPVTTVIVGDGTKNLVKVTVDVDGDRGQAGESVTATAGHPFWIPDLRKWVRAGELKPGMWLRTSAGTYVQITSIKRWTAHQRVYNLTVDDLHTYHVVAGDQAILVHNDDPRNGGWYGSLQPAGDGKEINHIPPHSVSPFSHHMGPAIRMDKADHRAVNSTGSSNAAKRWRQAQKDLIDSGDILGAMQMDVDDIRSRYGSKYDDAIQEMYDSLDSNKAWRDYASGC